METPNPEFDRKVTALVAPERWVIDGNYSRTLHLRLPRAEAVVLLDRNPLLCLWRVLGRARSSDPRPDIAEDCPERLPDRQFVWWILTYRWRSRPKVLRRVAEHPALPLVVLRSGREVERFLSELAGP